ncbi:hypothetical protein HDU93_005617 [Gonapodya sp. JEL0774]|nr:hypothetical protein HDU93_005617 [Gonapodya sp. JEL0774]
MVKCQQRNTIPTTPFTPQNFDTLSPTAQISLVDKLSAITGRVPTGVLARYGLKEPLGDAIVVGMDLEHLTDPNVRVTEVGGVWLDTSSGDYRTMHHVVEELLFERKTKRTATQFSYGGFAHTLPCTGHPSSHDQKAKIPQATFQSFAANRSLVLPFCQGFQHFLTECFGAAGLEVCGSVRDMQEPDRGTVQGLLISPKPGATLKRIIVAAHSFEDDVISLTRNLECAVDLGRLLRGTGQLCSPDSEGSGEWWIDLQRTQFQLRGGTGLRKVSLDKAILPSLGLTGETAHNAGNDAVLSLQAIMILMDVVRQDFARKGHTWALGWTVPGSNLPKLPQSGWKPARPSTISHDPAKEGAIAQMSRDPPNESIAAVIQTRCPDMDGVKTTDLRECYLEDGELAKPDWSFLEEGEIVEMNEYHLGDGELPPRQFTDASELIRASTQIAEVVIEEEKKTLEHLTTNGTCQITGFGQTQSESIMSTLRKYSRHYELEEGIDFVGIAELCKDFGRPHLKALCMRARELANGAFLTQAFFIEAVQLVRSKYFKSM